MKKIVVGEIIKNNKVMGTGFLVASDIVMTVKHNIITADEILEDGIEEKEVVFRINNHDEVSGTTINLYQSVEKGIDCVYIRLNETLCENEIQVLIEYENDITGYACNTKGFPKLSQGEIPLEGKIVSDQEVIMVSIKKEDQLQTYEGVSGAPLIVAGNVVGIITRQESVERLEALSINYVIENLGNEDFKTVKRELPDCFFDNVFSIQVLKQKAEQIISMVGPRYSKNLNVKTGTYNELSFILRKDGVKERLDKIGDTIGECIKKLTEFDSYNGEELILNKTRCIISDMITQLQSDRESCDIHFYNPEQLEQVALHMKVNEQKLKTIFELEKKRFEEKHGSGTFDNKSWRGFMASYMCTFPTQYLDELQDAIKLFSEIRNMLDVGLISKVSNQAVLISGKGGIGKTHLLCDIVNDYLEQGLPAVLILGDFLKEDTTADSIIMDWYYKDKELEYFYSWLNEIGEQNNVCIPVCIDAINEVNDKKYWNSNLPLLLAKAEKYNNIKMIFSCRSIYLEEYLESDKISNLLQLQHYGFDEMEVEALGDFCEYYGVNINYDTACVPEFMNPLFLKMLCEIAKEKDDKTVIVDDIQKLMNDFFAVKNKIISRNYVDYLSVKDESDIRRVILGLISISTKSNCALNAFYTHKRLMCMRNIRRDYILSFFLLKQYDYIKVVSDMCERAIALKETSFSEESVLLWKIMLCWGTSSNDIKLRDKSSKGLANLFRLYPGDMLKVVELFDDVDDDYIHERLWQAIYSAIIFLQKRECALPIMSYIKEVIIWNGKWPQNVLIRDSLRNIFEFSYYKGWISEKEVSDIRPPYKSKKHEANNEFILKFKDEFSKLYWNCQNSDFAIYTIPSEVEDYGISKKDVGLMIFEDILRSGYDEIYAEHDAYIDYTYGSLRNRDEQVERIGKKYQKIYLYREMGNIYDNYTYSPRFRYSEVEIVAPEQGNSFRNIDLTILNQENLFVGTSLEYPFYRYVKWNDIKWFEKNDVEKYIPTMITTEYEGKEYYILQGYLSSKEVGKKEFREVWMQIRTYLFSKNDKVKLLKWLKGKDFEGRWMPEGFGQLYECCVGEYPWSPIMINYLGQEEEQSFRQEKPAPCHLIATVNDYTAEKDSMFCVDEYNSYMFPSKYLFEKMNLVWNGTFGYDAKGQTVIFNGINNTLFIEKNFLLDFLNINNLEVAWTVLGEKQKITGGFGRDFPGRSEFSYSYYLDEETTLMQNHKVYNVAKPDKY